MARKQTRRSISVKGFTYQRLKEFCDARGISQSSFVEELIWERLGKPSASEVAAYVDVAENDEASQAESSLAPEEPTEAPASMGEVSIEAPLLVAETPVVEAEAPLPHHSSAEELPARVEQPPDDEHKPEEPLARTKVPRPRVARPKPSEPRAALSLDVSVETSPEEDEGSSEEVDVVRRVGHETKHAPPKRPPPISTSPPPEKPLDSGEVPAILLL